MTPNGGDAEALDEDLFRPSKDLQVEDESAKHDVSVGGLGSDGQDMPPPTRPAPAAAQDKGPKISFTMKSKAAPTPKPDLSQRMREPSSRRDTVMAGDGSRTRTVQPSFSREGRPRDRYEARRERRVLKRIKPRPTLPPEFATSDSVYYRRPGNESVVGSGTYGKVFKAIHVYTKNMVALKKIRMEGERDGVGSAGSVL